MFQDGDLRLQRRDLPRQFVVLGDELCEEGEDLFVGMVVIHWMMKKGVRKNHAVAGTAATEGADFPLERGEGRRPVGLWSEREKSPRVSVSWTYIRGLFGPLKTCPRRCRPPRALSTHRLRENP